MESNIILLTSYNLNNSEIELIVMHSRLDLYVFAQVQPVTKNESTRRRGEISETQLRTIVSSF